MAAPVPIDAPDALLTLLLGDVGRDVARMRVLQAVERITAFLRTDAATMTGARSGQWMDLMQLAEQHGVSTADLQLALDHAPLAVHTLAGLHPSVAAHALALQRRMAFRRTARGIAHRCTVISLGPSCSAWSVFNRWGFRDAPASVGSFNPFCLAGHRPSAIADMLLGGIEAYASVGMLMSAPWPNGKVVVRRSDAAALWSHHDGEHWHADAFQPFRDSIAELMGNLDRALASETGELKVFVFGHTTVNDPARLLPLFRGLSDALDQRCRGPWRLLAFNVPADAKLAPQPLLEALTPAVSLISMPMRADGLLYEWWEPAIYNSEAGVAWEAAIADLTHAALVGWAPKDG